MMLIWLSDSVYLTTNTVANFGTQEVHPFCAGFQCSVVMNATVTNVTQGNNGIINGTVTGGTPPFYLEVLTGEILLLFITGLVVTG